MTESNQGPATPGTAAREVWAQALEEAARCCELLAHRPRGNDYGNIGNAYDECAEEIRALAGRPQADAPAAPLKSLETALAAAEQRAGEAARAALHDEERSAPPPDKCPACGVRGLSMDRLGGACHALECPHPTAWLMAREASRAEPRAAAPEALSIEDAAGITDVIRGAAAQGEEK